MSEAIREARASVALDHDPRMQTITAPPEENAIAEAVKVEMAKRQKFIAGYEESIFASKAQIQFHRKEIKKLERLLAKLEAKP